MAIAAATANATPMDHARAHRPMAGQTAPPAPIHAADMARLRMLGARAFQDTRVRSASLLNQSVKTITAEPVGTVIYPISHVRARAVVMDKIAINALKEEVIVAPCAAIRDAQGESAPRNANNYHKPYMCINSRRHGL